MKIGIETNEVRTKAEHFRTTGKDRYQELRRFLDRVIYAELPELWRGSGSEAYIARYPESGSEFCCHRDTDG